MTRRQAERWLNRAMKHGYVPHRGGIVVEETGRSSKRIYGVNIDGDGRDGRLFGCPMIFWDQEHIASFFVSQGVEFSVYK